MWLRLKRLWEGCQRNSKQTIQLKNWYNHFIIEKSINKSIPTSWIDSDIKTEYSLYWKGAKTGSLKKKKKLFRTLNLHIIFDWRKYSVFIQFRTINPSFKHIWVWIVHTWYCYSNRTYYCIHYLDIDNIPLTSHGIFIVFHRN